MQVEEKRTGSLNFGAGFSTIDSIVGFVEVTQGNFDLLNWPNFTGAGQKFRARLQIRLTSAKISSSALTEPYFLDRRLSLGGEALLPRGRLPQLSLRPAELRLFDRRAKAGRPLHVRSVCEYRLEEIEIFDVSPTASQTIQEPRKALERRARSRRSFVYDTRDNPVPDSQRHARFAVTPYHRRRVPRRRTRRSSASTSRPAQYFHLP